MTRHVRLGFLAVVMLAVLAFAAACGGAAPAAQPTTAPAPKAAPTTAPAAPAATKAPAAAPTTAPAAAPTSAPAAKTDVDWPKQPITLIVPWAAGGDTDVPMRVAAEYIGKEIGQPIVVQNVTGASGTTGTRQARGAKPDGYTLLSIHEHVTVNQGVGLVDYGVEAFDPIANIIFSPEFLMSHPNNPWNTFEDLVQDAKQRPDEVTMGMTFGSTSQMFAFLLMDRGDIKIKPVGYDGTAQRMTALLGGQLDLSASPLSSALEMWKANRVKVLGFAAEERDPRLPDVPTFKEQGYDVIWGLNRGWVAPKGTDPAIIEKMAQAIERATKNPEFIKKVEDEMGSELVYMGPAEYKKMLEDQKADLLAVIKETGMTVEKK